MKSDIKKRILSVLLICMLMIAVIPTTAAQAAVVAEGSCGKDVTWRLEEGILTLSGSGDMAHYFQESDVPWFAHRDLIREVVFQEGITSVGRAAFYRCENLRRVVLAQTVTTIEDYAFKECSSLKFLDLPKGLTAIKNDAFYGCFALNSVRLPEGLQKLGSRAFYECGALTTITVPGSVAEMGTQVFAYCEKLVRAIIEAPLDTLPAWTFYGCKSLGTVTLAEQMQDAGEYAFEKCDKITTLYCAADKLVQETMKQAVQEGNTSFGENNVFSNDGLKTPGVSSDSQKDGSTTVNTVVKADETDNATITTEKVYTYGEKTEQKLTATINGIVESQAGWKDILKEAEEIAQEIAGDKNRGNLTVQVTTKNEAEAPQEVLERLEQIADKLVITTNNDTQWVLDGATSAETENSFAFGASVTELPEIPKIFEIILEGSRCYSVLFGGSSGYKIQVSLNLPMKEVGQVATLYAVNGKGEFAALQSVYVSTTGAATYYLDGVDTNYQYYIGMNPKDIEEETVLVPEVNAPNGITGGQQIQHIKPYERYVITGVKSAWGISAWQMTLFIVGGFVLVLGVVGYIMFLYNKQKLKNGYTMDLDMSIDEEEVARLERKKKKKK